MKKTAFLPILALLALPPLAAARQAEDPAARLDKLFARFNSQETPGCAVAVARDGKVVLARAYGMADLEHGVPNTPETIFEAGSVSKQFTAGAVNLLALQGKLALEDDVRKYIPEVPDYGTPITIRHLMTHTSGLRDWGNVAGISGWGRGLRVHTHAHVLDIVARQSALNFPPGHEYSYCNTGFNLLAIIVDRVSGMPFAEFCRKNIFDPLGMQHTQWRDDFTRIVKNRAVAYQARGERGFAMSMPFENIHGNGGLLTTVGDLLVWTENLETGRLGGPAFIEAMHRRGRLSNGRPIAYASGLRTGDYRGVPEISHTGSTAGYRAFLGRYPEQRMAVALLCNVGSVDPGNLGHQIADIFLGIPPAPKPAKADVDQELLKRRAGLYRNPASGEAIRLVFADASLRLERGLALTPVSDREFLAGSERRLTFEPIPGGTRERIRVARESVEDDLYEPVEPFAPAAAQLAEYAGDYYSPDAETALTAAIEEGRLVLRRRPDSRIALTPLYKDAFQSPLGLVRFIRGTGGRVTELSLRQDRVYDMRFRRAVP